MISDTTAFKDNYLQTRFMKSFLDPAVIVLTTKRVTNQPSKRPLRTETESLQASTADAIEFHLDPHQHSDKISLLDSLTISSHGPSSTKLTEVSLASPSYVPTICDRFDQHVELCWLVNCTNDLVRLYRNQIFLTELQLMPLVVGECAQLLILKVLLEIHHSFAVLSGSNVRVKHGGYSLAFSPGILFVALWLAETAKMIGSPNLSVVDCWAENADVD